MTKQEKMTVIGFRLDGNGIRECAEMVGMSRQNISVFLRTFPRREPLDKWRPAPKLSKEKMLAICSAYIDGASISKIAAKEQVSEEDVRATFDYLRQKRPPPVSSEQYPFLAEWMYSQGMTVQDFADEVGVPRGRIICALKGLSHMRLDTALKIKARFGIPLTDIYGTAIFQDDAEGVKT